MRLSFGFKSVALLFFAGLLLGLGLAYSHFGGALRDWRELAREERELSLDDLKSGIAEMKAWRAVQEEINQEFNRVLTYLHERELSLAAAPNIVVWTALLILVLVFALVWLLLRDANAGAALTVRSAITLSPPRQVRVFLASLLNQPAPGSGGRDGNGGGIAPAHRLSRTGTGRDRRPHPKRLPPFPLSPEDAATTDPGQAPLPPPGRQASSGFR